MNTNRLDQLTLEIQNYFDCRDPYVVPPYEPQVERHLVDMFEVAGLNGQLATLGRYHDGYKVKATIGEKKVAGLVQPGDVFLMALIRRQGKWRVWYMSPPYEEVEFDEEGAEDLH